MDLFYVMIKFPIDLYGKIDIMVNSLFPGLQSCSNCRNLDLDI